MEGQFNRLIRQDLKLLLIRMAKKLERDNKYIKTVLMVIRKQLMRECIMIKAEK